MKSGGAQGGGGAPPRNAGPGRREGRVWGAARPGRRRAVAANDRTNGRRGPSHPGAANKAAMGAAAPGRRRAPPHDAGPGRREGPRMGCGKAREEERPLPQTNGPWGGGEVRRIRVPRMGRLYGVRFSRGGGEASPQTACPGRRRGGPCSGAAKRGGYDPCAATPGRRRGSPPVAETPGRRKGSGAVSAASSGRRRGCCLSGPGEEGGAECLVLTCPRPLRGPGG